MITHIKTIISTERTNVARYMCLINGFTSKAAAILAVHSPSYTKCETLGASASSLTSGLSHTSDCVDTYTHTYKAPYKHTQLEAYHLQSTRHTS